MTQTDFGPTRTELASPRGHDTGPPVDPLSPFAGQQAYERRQQLRRSRGGRLRAVLAWLIALAMTAGAVYGGIGLTGYRLAAQAQLELGSATLTASPMSVPTPGDGQVVHVYVHPGEHVQAGAKLERVRLFANGASGQPSSLATITAPAAGIVSSVLAPRGDGILRGATLVQMYDPRLDTFQTTIDTATLGRLRKGMHATLTSPALPHPLAAVVGHVLQPAAAADQQAGSTATTATTPGAMTLVLRPVHPVALARLIPGLEVQVVVDTATGPKQAPSLARLSP